MTPTEPRALREVVTAAEMKARDAACIHDVGLPSAVLMERAALACTAEILARTPAHAPVCVLAGPGLNGGDGLAIARQLHQAGREVVVVLAADPARLVPETAAQLRILQHLDVPVFDTEDPETLESVLSATVWVDALLGIGTKLPLRGPIAALLEVAAPLRGDAFVLAVDLPSGVETDTGATASDALRADLTVTFDRIKWCHVLPPAIDVVGELLRVDIGLIAPRSDSAEFTDDATDDEVDGERSGDDHSEGESFEPSLPRRSAWIVEAADLRTAVPPMAPSAHKSSRGRAVVWAGSDEMPGAAVLASGAALRAGAGLVTLVAPPSVRAAALQRRPELLVADPADVMRVLAQADALLLGPGMGVERAAEALAACRDAIAAGLPTVLDADALTALAQGARIAGPDLILTPHPAELARLLGVSTPEVLADLPAAALAAAERWQCVVVAKMAGALVTDGDDTAIVRGGSPGMATAGSGDVLAGLLVALRAAHVDGNALMIAAAGAWLHARAGESAAQRLGAPEALVASDLIDGLGAAFARLRATE
jgi:hydroxyethylthiazole kinase-like uncharacterized protein yjeF